jgi:hypothetical protein
MSRTTPPITLDQWMRQMERRLSVQERRLQWDPDDDVSTDPSTPDAASPFPPGGQAGDVLYVTTTPAARGSGDVTASDLEWVNPQTQRPVAVRFVQATAAAVWTIPHTLEFRPNVSVVDSSWRQVFGEVSYPDDSTVQVDFSAAFAGEAYLS